jgi:hypothetical protein
MRVSVSARKRWTSATAAAASPSASRIASTAVQFSPRCAVSV